MVRERDPYRRDPGQALLVLLGVVVVAVLCVIAVASVGTRLVRREQAQAAADAAALAGVSGGRRAAEGVAARNGAMLVEYDDAEGVVTVVVERHGERARARATDGP